LDGEPFEARSQAVYRTDNRDWGVNYSSVTLDPKTFFPPPPPAPPEEPRTPVPEWARPPAAELGTRLPLRQLIVSRANVAIVLTDLIAYSTGFSFGLEILLHEPWRADQTLLPSPRNEGVANALKVAVEFENGRRATSLDPHRAWTGKYPDPPFMQVLGYQYGTGQSRIRLGWWVWPIPKGSVRIELEWPGEGVPLTALELGMDDVRSASGSEIALW